MDKSMNELSIEAFENSKMHGFHDSDNDFSKTSELFHLFISQKLALIHSEVSEALEADRKNRYADIDSFLKAMDRVEGNKEEFIENFKKYVKDTFEDELSDIMIRIFDLCGWLDIDIERHVELKMKYNSFREKKHNKEY